MCNLLTVAREVKNYVDNWRDALQQIIDEIEDFEVENYRFIASSAIDQIQCDELSSDPYILGCFNASAIAAATGWPEVLIEAAQKGEAYQEIGEAMSNDDISELQQIYSSIDGYGHHFSHYDGSEEVLDISDLDLSENEYYIFRTN